MKSKVIVFGTDEIKAKAKARLFCASYKLTHKNPFPFSSLTSSIL